MAHSYFPSTDEERIKWTIHYRDRIPIYASTLKISPEEIRSVQADLDFYIWLMQSLCPDAQSFSQKIFVYKALMCTGSGEQPQEPPTPTLFSNQPPAPAPGILNRIFAHVAKVKNMPECTDVIARDLKIVPLPVTEHFWPEFSLQLEQGSQGKCVCINFKKHGHHGVWIERRIVPDDWLALGPDNSKPHYDECPSSTPSIPRVFEYRLRWWDKGEPNGEFSPIQKIVVVD